METYIGLLRGINLGGKNKLPMPELAKIFEACDCEQVRTYIQSGNVVFCARRIIVAGLRQRIQETIHKRFGLEIPVVLRSAKDLAEVVRQNPYASRDRMEKVVSVLFLGERPSAERVKGLDPRRSPGDEFIVLGQEIYVWQPNGIARSKLTNSYFDSKLGTISTGRNWRTVLKLSEMAGHS